jgi:hypothetical protein
MKTTIEFSNLEFISKGEKGFIAGVALKEGKVPDRSVVIADGASLYSCGKTTRLTRGHGGKTVGSAKMSCNDGQLNFEGSFNLMRDEETKAFMVPCAAELYALVKNGDVKNVSAGIVFNRANDTEYLDNGVMRVKRFDVEHIAILEEKQAFPEAEVTQVYKDETSNNADSYIKLAHYVEALRAVIANTDREISKHVNEH